MLALPLAGAAAAPRRTPSTFGAGCSGSSSRRIPLRRRWRRSLFAPPPPLAWAAVGSSRCLLLRHGRRWPLLTPPSPSAQAVAVPPRATSSPLLQRGCLLLHPPTPLGGSDGVDLTRIQPILLHRRRIHLHDDVAALFSSRPNARVAASCTQAASSSGGSPSPRSSPPLSCLDLAASTSSLLGSDQRVVRSGDGGWDVKDVAALLDDLFLFFYSISSGGRRYRPQLHYSFLRRVKCQCRYYKFFLATKA